MQTLIIGPEAREVTAKQWSAEGIETTLAAQGIALAPGRAARLARALEGFLGPSMADPLRGALELECDPAGFALMQERLRAR
jgi:hypothetical protein